MTRLMTRPVQPAVATGGIFFEIERFDLGAEERLELKGRWFGVRGRRFVRPTLVFEADGERLRALADLEHKPWAPLDGEPWQAAFPCREGANVLDAELAVAPGIAVRLPAPGEALPEGDPIAALPADTPQTSRGRGPAPARRQRNTARSAVPGELATLREETQRLRQEPIRLQAELDRSEEIRRHVEGELERLKLDADGALARRNAAVDGFDLVAAERDQAVRERNEAVRELGEAVRARDAAVAERDAAGRRQDEAARARDEAARARDEAVRAGRDAVRARDQAIAARDLARAEAQTAVSERDAAVVARDAAIAERDAALSTAKEAAGKREKAVAERNKALAERDTARAQRAVAIPTRSVPPAPATPTPIFSADRDQLIKRVAAFAVLLVAVLALLMVLGLL